MLCIFKDAKQIFFISTRSIRSYDLMTDTGQNTDIGSRHARRKSVAQTRKNHERRKTMDRKITYLPYDDDFDPVRK